MPFTGASDPKLPENVQALPEGRREQWVAVFNSTFEKCQEGDGDDCEAAAFRQANGVVFDEKSDDAPKQETQQILTDEQKKQVVTEVLVETVEDIEANKVDATTSHVSVYKSADGQWRWASVSSVAIKDKEFEIVTEQAYDDAIEHAQKALDFGEIDLVHVDGTDVGKCDMMMRIGNQLIEGGTFDDTEIARGAIKALQDDPDYWGVSIKFVYDPSKFDGEKYRGNIRIKKRTILPQEMAASYGTRLVAIGGENSMEKSQLSDRAQEALERLNMSKDDIEKLAEKQVDPEPNTVEKEAEAAEPETVEVKKSLWDQIKQIGALFSKPEAEKTDGPGAETGGEEEEEETPVEAQETKETDLQEMVNGMASFVVESIAEAMSKKLDEKDEQIKSLGEAVLILSEQVRELKAPIEDQVEKRLAELPKIVKAAPSVTATTEATPATNLLPMQNQVIGKSFTDTLMEDIGKMIESAAANYNAKVQV